MLKRSIYIILFFLLAGFTPVSEQNASSEAEEYALKAAFLYNFSKYVEWPPSTMDNDFYVGVCGPSPILEPLREIARTKTVKGKKIIIKEYSNPEQIRFCHIL